MRLKECMEIGKACGLWQGRGCEPCRCNLLKPITDYVLEECVTENITKRTPLADIGSER